MNIESELRAFISNELLIDGSKDTLKLSDSLISSGRIDSLGLLKIVSFIQQTYDVDVMAVGEPEDFETIDSLASAIRRSR